MILFIKSSSFPCRTFLTDTRPNETVARVRSKLLHILQEIGHKNNEFRLRFNGQFLCDSCRVNEYNIPENAVLKMIPIVGPNRKNQSFEEDEISCHKSISGSHSNSIEKALLKETKMFKTRETILRELKALLYLIFLFGIFGFVSTHWYSGLWCLFIWFTGLVFMPTYNAHSGYIGIISTYKFYFCLAFGILNILAFTASVYLSVRELILIINHGCPGLLFVDDCSHQAIFSAILFIAHSFVFLINSVFSWILFYNIRIEVGDFIEKELIRSRDINEVLSEASGSNIMAARAAAFELATIAATTDDNKFRIIAEGGLDVLIRLTLCQDVDTQLHAVEALSELLTIPVIQENFIEMAGVRTLMTLLHSDVSKIIHAVLSILVDLIEENDENHAVIAADNGLDDLIYAANHRDRKCQRLVSGILLDLAFNSETRSYLAIRTTLFQTLIKLCKSDDGETRRLSLQTLELLAIENSETIYTQEGMLDLLYELSLSEISNKTLLLVGKLLLYFVETKESLNQLLLHNHFYKCMKTLAASKNVIQQKIVIKLIFSASEDINLCKKMKELRIETILTNIKKYSNDLEIHNMVDQAFRKLSSEEN